MRHTKSLDHLGIKILSLICLLGLVLAPTCFAISEQINWKYKIKTRIEPTPIVIGDSVYITGNDQIVAIDIDTGQVNWTYETEPKKSPEKIIIFDKTIYYKYGKDLYAIDRLSGVEKWNFSKEWRTTNPVATKSTVLFCDEEYNYALDAKTGSVKWKYKYKSMQKKDPVVVGDFAYYQIGVKGLIAMNVETGSVKWETENRSLYGSSLKIIDEYLCFVTNSAGMGAVTGLNLETGKREWGYMETSNNIDSNILKSGNVVYYNTLYEKPHGSSISTFIDTSRFNTYLIAVNLETKREKWKYQTGGKIHRAEHPAKLEQDENSIYYYPYYSSSIYVIDKETGRDKWKLPFPGASYSPVTLSDGLVYFVKSSENFAGLCIVDGDTGNEIWKLDIGIHNRRASKIAPILYNNKVLFNCTGFVYAVDVSKIVKK